MIEIKFDKKKKGKKTMEPTNKMETSKKLAWFSGICFAIAILYSIFIFTYGTIQDKMIDSAMPITLVTATAAVFGVTMASYMNKGRYENTMKINRSFLREKYDILKAIGVLDNCRAVQEIEDELTEIEADFDNEKSMANQEITYNG